jgi:tRNA 2-thiouridine synthesizing protein A
VDKFDANPAGDIVLDARGHRCPVPTLRLRRALERAKPGEVIRLLADDPLARIDIPHFAAEAGAPILSLESAGADIVVRLLKP